MDTGIRIALQSCALIVSLLAGCPAAFAQYVEWTGFGPGGEGRPESNSAEGRRTVGFDSEGNTFVAGWVDNYPDATPLLVKYDSNGAVVWQRRVDSDNATYGRGVGVDGAGNSIMFAYSNNYPIIGAHLVKYASSGELLWSLPLRDESGKLYLSDLAVNPAGDFYVLGRASDGTEGRTFVTRYSATGGVLWQATLPNPANSSPILESSALEVDAEGNSYICSTMRAPNNVGAGLSIIRISSTGTIGWQRDIGGALSCADFGIDREQRMVVVSEAPEGLAIYQFDTSGNQLWASTLPLQFKDPDLGLDGLGNITVLGRNGFAPNRLIRTRGTNGQLIWERTLDSNTVGLSLSVDNSGSPYVADVRHSNDHSSYGATKFDASGAVIWSKVLTDSTVDTERFGASSVTPSGNLVITGLKYTLEFDRQLLTREVLADGTEKWTTLVSPQLGLPQSGTFRDRSDFTVTTPLVTAGSGYFTSSLVWNGWNWESHVDSFSGAGALLWSRTEDSVDASEAFHNIDIGAGPSGEHYDAHFSPTTCSTTNWNKEQFVLSRRDDVGQLVWQRVVWTCADPNRPYYTRIAVAPDGLVYAVGRLGDRTEIASYSSDGEERWRKMFNIVLPDPIKVPVRFDPQGNFVIVGRTTEGDAVMKISPDGLTTWLYQKPFEDGFWLDPVDVAIGTGGEVALIFHRSGGSTVGFGGATILLSATGTELWSDVWLNPNTLVRSPQSVVVDSNGSVTSVLYSDKLDVPYLERPQSTELVRYDRGGVKLWGRFVREGISSYPTGVALDSGNNVWLVMADEESDDSARSIVVAKILADGAQQWAYRYPGNGRDGSIGHAAQFSRDGALIVAASVNADSATGKFGLIRISDQPRADPVFTDGFEGTATIVDAPNTLSVH